LPQRVDIFFGSFLCSCAGGVSQAKQEKITKAFSLARELKKNNNFEVHTWRLGDKGDYEKGISLLKDYLINSGEEDLAKDLTFSLNSVTPAVALNGRVIGLGDVPEEKDLTSGE